MKKLFWGLSLACCLATLLCLQAAAQTTYSFRHLTTDDGLLNNEVKSLRFDAQGTLWIETQGGWNIWDGQTVGVAKDCNTPAKTPALRWTYSAADRRVAFKGLTITLPKDKSTTAANTVLDVKDDGRGHLWLATDHEGAYIYNKVKRTFTHLTHMPSQSTGIAENHVSSIAIARDGTVALGHIKKGVSVCTPLPFRLTHFQSTTWRNISAVAEDTLGHLWLGTDGYGLFDVTSRRHVGIPGNIVVSLLCDSQGRLWAGTYQNGLLCLQDGRMVKQYTRQNSRLSDNNVYSLCQDHTGRLWVGTLFGHLQTLDPATEQWTDYKSENGKNEAVVMDFAYDGRDELYAATLWGLCRIDTKTGKRQQLFTNRAGQRFLHEDIQSVHKDHAGRLWLAHGHGVTVWDLRTDSIIYLTKEQGLCDDVIRCISEDQNGRVWIGTSNGIQIYSPTLTPLYSLKQASGLLDSNISRHCIIPLRDGSLLICSYEGYSIAGLTDKPHPLEQAKPYEIGEEWTVWTSWQAIVIYCAAVILAMAIWLLMRRAKRKAIAAAIKKAGEVWRENPAKHLVEVAPKEIEITSIDEQLVKKAINTVEENISNDLTVEQLAEALALTRGHLYKKLTALTGKTPVEFIRTIRMKRACQLLDKSGMQVSEVAYAVGYSSPKIFSRNFKAEMGMTPTEYMSKRQH